MFKAWLFVTAVCLLIVIAYSPTHAQATKKLGERTATSAQQKSWEQVDKINRETDATKSRYQQAQRSGIDKRKYTGGNITKSSIFPRTPKAKPSTKKADTAPKKKK